MLDANSIKPGPCNEFLRKRCLPFDRGSWLSMSLGFASVLAMGSQTDSEGYKPLKGLVAGEGFEPSTFGL